MQNALFKALNDPIRRRILDFLRQGELSAGEIADKINADLEAQGRGGISKPSVSHHLDLLKRADLVWTEKRGQFIHYSLNTSVLDEVLQWLLNLRK